MTNWCTGISSTAVTPELLEVLDHHRVGDRRVGAAHLLRDVRVGLGQALDVRLVDDGLVVRGLGRAVACPVEERVDDDRLHHVRRAVVVVEPLAGRRTGSRTAPRPSRCRPRPPWRTGRAAAWPGCTADRVRGVVRPVHAEAVALAGSDVRQVAVPDEGVDLRAARPGSRCRPRRTGTARPGRPPRRTGRSWCRCRRRSRRGGRAGRASSSCRAPFSAAGSRPPQDQRSRRTQSCLRHRSVRDGVVADRPAPVQVRGNLPAMSASPATDPPVWVALLRGINVGASHRVTMVDLRAAVVAAGGHRRQHAHPERQRAAAARDGATGRADRAARVDCLGAALGFPVPVILRTRRRARRTWSPGARSRGADWAEDRRRYVSFLAHPPEPERVDTLLGRATEGESLYVTATGGLRRGPYDPTKPVYADIERDPQGALRPPERGTWSRNWRTSRTREYALRRPGTLRSRTVCRMAEHGGSTTGGSGDPSWPCARRPSPMSIRGLTLLLTRTVREAWSDRILGLSAEAGFWQLLSLVPADAGRAGHVRLLRRADRRRQHGRDPGARSSRAPTGCWRPTWSTPWSPRWSRRC